MPICPLCFGASQKWETFPETPRTLNNSPQFLFNAFFMSACGCLVLSCILQRIPADFRKLKISCLQTFAQQVKDILRPTLEQKKHSQHPKDHSSWRIRSVYFLFAKIGAFLE